MEDAYYNSKYDNAISVCQKYGQLDEDKKLRLAGKNLNKEYERWLALAVDQTTFFEMQTGHFLLKYFRNEIEKADKIADKLILMDTGNEAKYLEQYAKYKNFIVDNESTRSKRIEQYPLPCNWLKFYIYFRFPAGIIFTIIAIISYFLDSSNNYFADGIFLFDFFSIALMIVTFIYMYKLTRTGYYLNIVFLFYGMIIYGLNAASQMLYTANAGAAFLISMVVYGAAWILPNMIYFKKRKSLFIDTNEIKEKNSTPYNAVVDIAVSGTEILKIAQVQQMPSDNYEQKSTVNNEIIFCRKCGNKLLADSIFCNKCGTKIKES